jgi:hypothetical protein
VQLLGRIDTFKGPKVGCTLLRVLGRPATPSDYWEMFWTDDLLEPIVLKTNRYARTS